MTRAFHHLAKRWRLVALVVALLAGILTGWSGAGPGLERGLAEARYALRDHPSAGNVAIVEIDARSIAAIDRWPWPRHNYSAAVDELRRARVASIAFDIDFSAPSNPVEDRAFAASLARADGLVTLPTFRQAADNRGNNFIDSLPIPELRAHSVAATVSVLPDADGNVRNAPFGEITDGLPRPSLAAMIAGRNGSAGTDFPIDYSIDPASIPRFSFIDVRDGKVDPELLRGKKILVGTTAIELGDRYGVPRFGVIPGVVIQALAALTLEEGTPSRAGWFGPLAFAIALGWLLLRARSTQLLIAGVVAATLILFFASTLASAEGWETSLVPAFIALYTTVAWISAVRVNAWLAARRAVDDATGLPNQHALADAIGDQEGAAIATVRIAEYDRLLATVGAKGIGDLICRLRDRISVLGGGITVYRVDDRVLAWQAVAQPDQLAIRHEQLRTLMLTPVEVTGRKVDVSVATGMAIVGEHGAYPAIANASMAADLALTNGIGWHLHQSSDAEAASTELSLASDLDDAIAAGDVFPLYQPKRSLRTGEIASVEALVRWNHRTQGMLRPDVFIPVLERAGRIASLTLHVVASAIRDVETWCARGHCVTAAVNLSATLLESAAFIDQLEALLRNSGVDPRRLIFEVTESAAMHAPDVAAAALGRFKSLGVAISMDDYGTGQSTLTYLKKLPLDELKIDRSFVEFAHQNRGDAVLVRSTIDLAHELGLKVVAEGVETEECLQFLKSVDCDLVQGYLISRPIDAYAVEAMLDRDTREAA